MDLKSLSLFYKASEKHSLYSRWNPCLAHFSEWIVPNRLYERFVMKCSSFPDHHMLHWFCLTKINFQFPHTAVQVRRDIYKWVDSRLRIPIHFYILILLLRSVHNTYIHLYVRPYILQHTVADFSGPQRRWHQLSTRAHAPRLMANRPVEPSVSPFIWFIAMSLVHEWAEPRRKCGTQHALLPLMKMRQTAV